MGMFNDGPVWRLLRANISVGQLAGYLVANLVGLMIVITALQFYRDVQPSGEADDPMLSRDYMVVSKKVDGLGALMGDKVAFTEDDIADLASQPWAINVGRFTPSDFSVSASVNAGGHSMSTYLFFEAIPDEFFDELPDGWDFDPGRPFIPVVLPREYLSLYNFGFAGSQGMPQLSEDMVGLIPVRVSLSGRGRQQWFNARVVGFSSRLNTIAVPLRFMEWANAEFGEPAADRGVSRLIVEVDNPGDPAIEKYLSAYGIETAGDGGVGGRTAYFFTVVTGVVMAVGLVICLLALFILILSIYLLMQKSRAILRDLMLLGYSPRMISRYYYVVIAAANCVVLTAVMILLPLVRGWWLGPLQTMGLPGGAVWPSLLVALAMVLVITAVNFGVIRRSLLRIWWCG